MNPLTRSAYAADVRHLVQFSGIEHALTVRDSRTPDEALALQIVRAVRNALPPPRDRGAD